MNSKKMKKLVLILFIFCNVNLLFAKDLYVTINNAKTELGIIEIPVLGNTNNNFTTNKIKYSFDLDGAFAEVLEIKGGNDFGFEELSPKFEITEKTAGHYILTVFSEKVKSNFEGKLFNIVINMFPKMDFYYKDYSSLKITPTSAAINDKIVDITANAGIISITNIEANQTYNERVSYAYPNPFSYETEIYFSIKEETTLKLTISNYVGEIIQEIPAENDIFNFIVMNAAREIIDFTEDYIFPRGLYKMVLRPEPTISSMGNYRLLFETKYKKHNINISFSK